MGLTIGISQTRPPRNAPLSGNVTRRAFLILPNSWKGSTDDKKQSTGQARKDNSPYRLNFTFVIPHQIPEGTRCSHPKKNLEVEQAHSALLPTFGAPWMDPNSAAAPDAVRVAYAIFVRVFGNSQTEERPQILAVAAKEIIIMPIISRFPSIDSFSLKMRATHTVDHGSGQQAGKLSAELSAIIIGLRASTNVGRPSRIEFRTAFEYIAKKDEQPPRVVSFSPALCVHTFYSTGPFEDIPDQWVSESYQRPRGGTVFTYKERLQASERLNLTWHEVSPNEPAVMRSGGVGEQRSMHRCKATKRDRQNHLFASHAICRIPIPFKLSGYLTPTFHSCIISRTYSLLVDVSYPTSSGRAPSNTMTLHGPVLICVAPRG